MSNDEDTVSKGTSLGGCTVQEKLSQRGGATRYRAIRDSGGESGEECVITVYHERCFPSALVRERSIRELRQLSSLNSPKILPVLDVGKLDDGGIYEINAPFSERTLAQLDEALDEEQAFAILRAIGESLLAAQNAGVIHRNLGPELVYLEEGSSSTLKVGGFGVAEPQGEGSFGPLSTLAPEQVAGKVVDQRSMVYNLAALGQRLLSGKDLYQGSPQEVLKQHLEAEIPGGVHPRLARGLQKDARRRPMMLKQFLDELTVKSAASSQGSGVEAAKPSTRGWTQFMDDDQVEGGSSSGSSAPAASAASASPNKPATRGWTMFMECSDAEPEPAEEKKAPAPAAQEKKPATRGWTMFMDSPEESQDEAQEADSGKESAEPAPALSAKESKPKTRGWTMFMDDDPAAAPQSVPEPAAPAPQQVAASTPSPSDPGSQKQPAVAQGDQGPSTRGWTQFMDAPPGSEGGEASPPTFDQASSAAAKVEPSAPSQEKAPSANGVHHDTEAPQSSPRSPSRPEAKSAVEASNRRVSMGMPKPAAPEESQVDSAAASPSASASRSKTVVMGGSQAEAVAGPAEPVQQDSDLASKADIAHDQAAARPLTDPTASAASTSTSSVLSKNPIPESPAPQGSNEPSLVRVAVGAGLVGVVIAALALLVMFLIG